LSQNIDKLVIYNRRFSIYVITMKLKEYFDEVKKMKLDESQKMAIFEEFIEKSYRQSFLKRWSFYVKVWVYTVLIVFFIYSFFPIIFYQSWKPNVVVTKIESITWGVYLETKFSDAENKTTITNVNKVFAKDVGKIVYAKWDFVILRKWKSIKTDKLLNWDYVVLSVWTDLKFKLNNWLYWKISWPAKLQIQYISWQGVYIINLLKWKYSQFSAQIFSWAIKLKSDDIVISPITNKNFNIKIVQQKKKKIIENVWKAPIVLEKVDKKVKKTLKAKEVAKVNGDIKIYKLIQDIKKGNIKTETKLSTWVDVNILDETMKLVPSVEQIKSLTQILYSKFISKDILNLINYYGKNWEDIAIKNLMYRILRIYKIFDLKIDSEILKAKIKSWKYDIDDLFLVLDQLISKLQESYYLEPSFVVKLKKLEAWILLLKKGFINTDLKYKSLQEVLEKNNLKNFKGKLLF